MDIRKVLDEQSPNLQIASKMFAIYALILTLFGTLVNMFSFYVCLKVKNNSTFTFMTFFAISNIVSIHVGKTNNLLKQLRSLRVKNLWLEIR